MNTKSKATENIAADWRAETDRLQRVKLAEQLHVAIMTMPVTADPSDSTSYRLGWKDGRRAAAEIVKAVTLTPAKGNDETDKES